jgi:hypothetical protein
MSLTEFVQHYRDYQAGDWQWRGVTEGDALLAERITNMAGKMLAEGHRATVDDFDPFAEPPTTTAGYEPTLDEIKRTFGVT